MNFKKLGVTLLEILLVLVIASLILMMSVRYYQAATTASKANDAARTLSLAISMLDSYISTGGTTLSEAGTLPTGTWGDTLKVSGDQNTYTLTFPNVPATACPQFKALATQGGTSTRVTSAAACGSSTTALSFTVTPFTEQTTGGGGGGGGGVSTSTS